MKLQNMKNIYLLLSASLLIASCGPHTGGSVRFLSACSGTAPVEDIIPVILRPVISLWQLDKLSGIRICMDAKCRTGFQTLCDQWKLDLYRCRMDLGFQLQLGMGSISLWPMVLRKRIWMDVGTRKRMGSCLGKLEGRRRLLWMGTDGPKDFRRRGPEQL